MFKHVTQIHEWESAMQIEFDALLKNQTWELVPYDSSKNFISRKWLYRIKRNADGIVNRYKAPRSKGIYSTAWS